MKYLCTGAGRTFQFAAQVPDDFAATPPYRLLDESQYAAAVAEYLAAEAVPASISARQARLWLVRQGIALAAVDAAIASIPDAVTRESVRVEWEYGTEVHRDSAWLAAVGMALGLDAAAIDTAFREAAGL